MFQKYLQESVYKYKKYGNIPNTIDIAKFLAVVLMVIDHLGYYNFQDNLWLRAIGRESFPIWGFFSGYSRPTKFSYNLYILFTLLLILKAALFFPIFPLDILLTIIISRFYADFLRKDNKILKWKLPNLIFIFLTLLIWSLLTNYIFEYGTLAFMFTICGVMHRERPGHFHTTIAFIFTIIIYVFYQYVLFDFSSAQFILLAIGMLITMHFLSGLKMLEFQYLEKFGLVTKIGMFIARNSLYFYFLHIILFTILSKIVSPEFYKHFRWL